MALFPASTCSSLLFCVWRWGAVPGARPREGNSSAGANVAERVRAVGSGLYMHGSGALMIMMHDVVKKEAGSALAHREH